MVNDTNYKSIAYAEILNILRKMEEEYVYKIPIEIIEYLNDNCIKDDEESYLGFDENGNIKVTPEAEKILLYLNLKYWANEEEKKELLELYTKNEQMLDEEYDIDKILKKRNKTNTDENIGQLVVIKETLFKKVINKIRELLRIK